ncbi:transcription factor Sox-17-alpha-A-like isoform X2 [Sander lucioperca]|uniref:Transcription factor 7-like 1-A n=1 Tax=Sander lucioperca TaxID=283035 RepID=A0A8C9YZ92_SANLU|nr:transcription factor Sox-17-alpha-A-like isoform X2 [Sander lucioperca]
MDVSAEIERAIEEMERGELLSTVWAAIDEILADTSNPPSPPLVPAELELNTHPQPVESQAEGYGACIPMMADPHMFEQQNPLMAAPTMYDGLLCQGDIIQPGHLYSQAGAYSQGQYLPYLWPVADVPTATAVSHPAAAPQPCNIAPVVKLSEGQSLRWVGVWNGEMLYEVIAEDHFAPPVSTAPPLNTSKSGKRKCESQQDENRPYVKKPPNAFMLFMKEQRVNVEAELNIKGIRTAAAVNTVLGRKWNSLTKEEQAKYYDKAEEEKWLHAQRHPGWTTRDNYGKKRKRQRKVKASASNPEEDTQQAKKLCVTPVQTAVMESSSSLTEAPHTKTRMMEPCDLQTVLGMEAPQTQTVLVQLPHTQTAVTVPVFDMCHLPQVYEVSPASWLDPPETASTSLASPGPLTLTQIESTHSEDVGGQVSPSDSQLKPPSSPHCTASAALL